MESRKFDIGKTVALIKNGLFEPSQTWQRYLDGEHNWKDTAVTLALPLIIGSVLLSAILGLIMGSWLYVGVLGTILSLVAALLWVFVASFIFSYFAGVFNGEHDFNRGFAALTLAAIPGYIGQILMPLPYVGWLIALGMGVLGLVYLYKIIPSYLKVPESKRTAHFISSLLASVVLVFGINMLLGVGATSSVIESESEYGSQSSDHVGGGIFGDAERYSKLIKDARKDRYSPPEDGEITEGQMKTYVKYMQKTTEYTQRQREKIHELEKGMKEDKEFTFADLGKFSQGVGTVMSTGYAEMEVVKTAGGNWAEHKWIKEQLRSAAIHPELNDANKHNHALYDEYSEELKSYGVVY